MRATATNRVRIFFGIGTAAILASLSGLGFAADDNSAPGAAPGIQLPATQIATADSFRVPDGTPEQLIAFLDGLKLLRPAATRNIQDIIEFSKKLAGANVEAADKILAAHPTKEQTTVALEHKLGGLAMLDQLGDAAAGKQLQPLCRQIQAADLPQLARRAEAICLVSRLRKIKSPEQAEELSKLVADVKTYLSAARVERADLQLAFMCSEIVEQFGSLELTGEVYRDLAKIISASDDKQIAAFAAKLEGGLRRANLKDTPMVVEGTTLDGKPFDWSAFAGKVVLVDFWATWCGPCKAELPNVERNYAAYHDRGFEVVGISLDRSKSDLDAFLEREKLPWTIILDGAGPKEPGAVSAAAAGPRSAADYYGVLGIPTCILLGKDGKAISLHARGENLTKELEKIYGPASKAPPASSGAPSDKPAKAG